MSAKGLLRLYCTVYNASMQKQQLHSILPTVLVIFGATGDLTRRKLIPALFRLYQDKALPEFMHIVGFARRSISDEDFRAYVKEIILEKEPASAAGADAFVSMFSYRAGDFTDPNAFEGLAELLGKQDSQWRTCANKLFHLAVAPEHYEGILNNLAASGLTVPCSPEEGWTRVLVEKPFGKDLETSQALDGLLAKLFFRRADLPDRSLFGERYGSEYFSVSIFKCIFRSFVGCALYCVDNYYAP